MGTKAFLSILFLIAALVSGASDIRCKNAEYAGKELVFQIPSDPVSETTSTWFTLKFDNSGIATASVNLSQPQYGFADFGIYRGMLFLEPGKNIDLKLPPLREKSFADQKNPYFEPVSFWFITEGGKGLSDQISAFEQKADFLAGKNFNKLYMLQSKTVFDSVKTELLQEVSATASQTMKEHAKLKVDMLETDVFRKQPESYAALFNNIQPEYWLQPAFIAFFNKTFDKQLSFSAQAIKGDQIKKAVAAKDLPALFSFFENKFHVTGKMADLALLKMLHDAFYANDFPKEAVKDLVVNERFTKNSNLLIRTTSENIAQKISFLQPASAAPVICLNDLTGKKICTNSSKDKFKYLVFADAETMVCREHLKYLSRISELFDKHLEIFVILRDTDPAGIKSFFNENKVPATVLVDKGGSFTEKYKVRSFPQCFLLNEKHEVVFENAKSPLDGFEQQFGTWLRNDLFMRQRNQNR